MSLRDTWEEILRQEGLSMSQGTSERLVFVESTDDYQRERPRSIGKDGGLLSREYRLGEKETRQQRCKVCEALFTSRRKDAELCSPKCRKRASRSQITHPNTEETVNAPAE